MEPLTPKQLGASRHSAPLVTTATIARSYCQSAKQIVEFLVYFIRYFRCRRSTAKYVMYCPGNCRWPAAFMNMLGRAYGACDIGGLARAGYHA